MDCMTVVIDVITVYPADVTVPTGEELADTDRAAATDEDGVELELRDVGVLALRVVGRTEFE